MYTFYLDTWDLKSTPDKTYANFKLFFNTAYKKIVQTGTLAGSSYANNATGTQGLKRKQLQGGKNGEDIDAAAFLSLLFSRWRLKYCWSCGCNRSHFGPGCNFKKEGHKDEATLDHMMGGCNLIQRHKNEKAKWNTPQDRTNEREGGRGGGRGGRGGRGGGRGGANRATEEESEDQENDQNQQNAEGDQG